MTPLPSEKIRVSCSGCAASLRVNATVAGKTIRCPKCQTPVTVPKGEDFELKIVEEAPPPVPPPPPEKIEAPCPGCGAQLRVNSTAAGKTIKCPKCGGPVKVEDDLQLNIHPQEPDEPDIPEHLRPAPAAPAGAFYRRLNTAVLYPVRNLQGVMFLAIIGPIFSVTLLVGGIFGLIGKVMVGGYIAIYMFQILYDAAMKDQGPAWPDFTDFWELILCFFRFFFATTVAFLPAIGLLLFAVFSNPGLAESGGYLALLGAVSLFCVFYYPMALMLIGFGENLFAPLNYWFGLRSIFLMPLNYLVCVLYLIGVTIGMWALMGEVAVALPDNLFGAVLALGLVTTLALYLWAIQMRVLSLLYVCNKERLGWFR